MFQFISNIGSKMASLLRNPKVQAGLKAGATAAASAYAGPAGAKAVDVVGPKVLDVVTKAVDPDVKIRD